jgi:hypothetical protein
LEAAVEYVTALGLRLAEVPGVRADEPGLPAGALPQNSERVCPACQGTMKLTPDLLGCARWLCKRCGYSTT